MSSASIQARGHVAPEPAVAGCDRLHVLGIRYIQTVPLVACMTVNIGFEVGGFNSSGMIWVAMLAVGLYLLSANGSGGAGLKVLQPCGLWMPWIAILWASLLWCPEWGRSNVQQACQISMPLLVAAVSSKFVRSEDDLRAVFRAFLWGLALLAGGIILTRLGALPTEGTGNRDYALSVALIGCMFLARAVAVPLRGYLGWAACLALILLSSSRMAAVALVGVILLHPAYKGLGRRLFSLLLMVACGLAVFYSPMFQERTFYDGQGSIGDLVAGDRLDTAGRFGAWPYIWEEAWKNPILGTGVGTVRDFTLSVWPDVSHPHNDYLRIGFECGLAGLALFLLAVSRQMLDLWRQSDRSQGMVREFFMAAFMGFAIMLITSASDNTLVYNLAYTDPLFVLMGSAYGAASTRSPENQT